MVYLLYTKMWKGMQNFVVVNGIKMIYDIIWFINEIDWLWQKLLKASLLKLYVAILLRIAIQGFHYAFCYGYNICILEYDEIFIIQWNTNDFGSYWVNRRLYFTRDYLGVFSCVSKISGGPWHRDGKHVQHKPTWFQACVHQAFSHLCGAHSVPAVSCRPCLSSTASQE